VVAAPSEKPAGSAGVGQALLSRVSRYGDKAPVTMSWAASSTVRSAANARARKMAASLKSGSGSRLGDRTRWVPERATLGSGSSGAPRRRVSRRPRRYERARPCIRGGHTPFPPGSTSQLPRRWGHSDLRPLRCRVSYAWDRCRLLSPCRCSVGVVSCHSWQLTGTTPVER
jgi:hypothetical protein